MLNKGTEVEPAAGDGKPRLPVQSSGFHTPTELVKTPPNDSPKGVGKQQQQIMDASDLIELVKALMRRMSQRLRRLRSSSWTTCQDQDHIGTGRIMCETKSRAALTGLTRLGPGSMRYMTNHAPERSSKKGYRILETFWRWIQSYQQRSHTQPEEAWPPELLTTKNSSFAKVSRLGVVMFCWCSKTTSKHPKKLEACTE